ncbi:hypothetical protein [Streptacidiphilus sp. PAMC 29251]
MIIMPIEGAGESRPGAHDLMAEARVGVLADSPAFLVLIRLLTVRGRIPFDHAVAGLTVMERSVLHQITGNEDLRLLLPEAIDADSGDFAVTYSAQGKLSLLDASEYARAKPDEALAGLRVSPPIRERAEEEVAAWELAERCDQTELDRILRRWESAGCLPDRVHQAADWVDRVETVLIYSGRQVFSRSDAGTSTLLRDRLLEDLADEPLDRWSMAERLFVVAVHLLFIAGRSVRFEEFNGRQLSASGLRTWLVSTWRSYAHAVARDIPTDLTGRAFETLAHEVAELSTEVNMSEWVRFRRISGMTFAKNEVLVPLPLLERTHAALPEQLVDFAERTLGMPIERAATGEEAVHRMVLSIMSEQPARSGALLERLLAAVVRAAVVDLDADYGMSSAVRDMRRLGWNERDRTTSALRLRKPDFFCCALPHPSRLDGMPTEDVRRILWLVAQRMQYNRWHFVPGNFEREEVPAQRHYFFPPAVPDIAESAELWHGGHVAARVRYSIRAPGSHLWRPPLTVLGNDYRGGYDIRLVRMNGAPFVRNDLWVATRYSGLVDALWRAVAQHAEAAAGSPFPVVTAFDHLWYQEDQWRDITDPLVQRS